MKIALYIRNRRKELHMTLLDVAKIVGVSEATVQRWESGSIKSLRHERIGKLAHALQVSPSKLMGWDEETAKDLDEVGVQWLDLVKGFKREGLSPAEVRQLVDAVKKFQKGK